MSFSTTKLPAETQARFDIAVQLDLLDGARQNIAARLHGVSPGLFEVSCPETLRVGQRLALSHAGRRLQLEVSPDSQKAAGVYLLSVKSADDRMSDVRSELRLPIDLPAMLRVAGEAAQIAVRVVNMSPSGMGIELTKELEQGAKACIDLEQGLAFGEIRFCRPKDARFYSVGFRLEEYICQEDL